VALLLRITIRAASEIERAEKWWVENRPPRPVHCGKTSRLGLRFWLLLQHPGVGVKEGWPDFGFAFHDGEELGLRMLARIAKHTGLAWRGGFPGLFTLR
jgi:hypothetical protein